MYTYLFYKTVSSQFNGTFPEIRAKSTDITVSLLQKITFFPNKHFILYKIVHMG